MSRYTERVQWQLYSFCISAASLTNSLISSLVSTATSIRTSKFPIPLTSLFD
nr:MAG TPA: hypothetical protein [Caudoviricetes sp.]